MAVCAGIVSCGEWRGGGKGKEVTQCVQVNATRWPHGDSSLQTLEESCAHSKGLILNSLDTSNIRIKIEAPEGFSENKMKGESPRGNPEFAWEAKWRAIWWAPRSRAGSFIGGESLGKGQLGLAPGWTGGYENQMTIVIIIRCRLHSVLTDASRNSESCKTTNLLESGKGEGMFCTKYPPRSVTNKDPHMIPHTRGPTAGTQGQSAKSLAAHKKF